MCAIKTNFIQVTNRIPVINGRDMNEFLKKIIKRKHIF